MLHDRWGLTCLVMLRQSEWRSIDFVTSRCDLCRVVVNAHMAQKLVALIPPPRRHLVRWSGVFAPNSPYRRDITLRPDIKKGFQFVSDKDETEKPREFKNYKWSKMLAQVFKIDVTKCQQCGGTLVKVCAVTDLMQTRRYLKQVGLDYEPPPRAPPRQKQGEFHFEPDDWSSEHLS